MSILSSTHSGLLGDIVSIEKWLNDNDIQGYELTQIQEKPYWKIVIQGKNVNLVGFKNESLPDYIVFDEIIGGHFICSYSNLTSMKGFPKKVGGNFDISYSKISSLENVPQLIDRDFVACGLNFTKEEIKEKTRVTQVIYC